MKTRELLACIETVDVKGPADTDVLGIACDSRQVRPGMVFAALPGRNEDGWRFAAEAVRRGAVAVVGEHDPGAGRTPFGPDVCLARVADARRALADLSAAFYQYPAAELLTVGITGTNGKTTTAYMVRDVLQADGRSPGLVSTVQYEIGERVIPAVRTTPEAPALQALLAQMVDAGCRSAVMEVSSHALDQQRVNGTDIDIGVFTNLTRDHLDYHGSMEAYFDAKMRLFRALGRGGKSGLAVVNTDDPWGQRIDHAADVTADRLTYGTDPTAAIQACDIRLGPEGSAFRVLTPWGETEIRTTLMGRFNVSNLLAALGAVCAAGVQLELAARVLSSQISVTGRLERIANPLGIQVFVDYAHTDDALRHVLATLREVTARRLIVVVGCGGNRDRSKRPAMGAVAAKLADAALLTADNPRGEDPRAIIREMEAGIDRCACCEVIVDRRDAIFRAIAMAEPGDVVLIAGKGHETFQEFANRTAPFDDRQVAREALERR